MRIIVAGGTGLIGRALTAELIGAGHEVVLLSRRAFAGDRVEGRPNLRAVRWDGRTPDGWAGELEGAGAVVNLAGENIGAWLWTPARKARIRDSRLWAGEAIVEAFRRAGNRPAVLVQSSGVGIYGDRGDEELTEQSSPGSDWLARLGVEWEGSTAAVEALGVRRAVVRTGGVLSLEGGLLPKWLLPFRFFVGGRVGSGRQWFPWIHLADEARAIRFLIEEPRAAGAFNLVAPDPVRHGQFTHAIGRALGRPSFMAVPAVAVRLALGELGDLLLTGQRAYPRKLQELHFAWRFTDPEAALRDLLGRPPAAAAAASPAR